MPPLFIVVWGMFFAVLISFVGTFPYWSDWYLLVSILIGIFGFLSFVWVFRKPNFYAKFFFQASLSAMLALGASRCFSYLFPQSFFVIYALILIAFLYTQTLPMWDTPTAVFIRNELMSPKTRGGKIFFRATLVFASIGMPLALVLGHYAKSKISILFLGTLSLFMSMAFPFSGRVPSSPWEASPPIIDQQDNKKQEIKEKHPLSLKKTSGRISSKKRIEK